MAEQFGTPPKSESLDLVAKIKEVIHNAPAEIEAEFARDTSNNWLRCFGSITQVILWYLTMDGIQKHLSSEQLKRSREQLDALMIRAAELQSQYPKKENVPPIEIRKELIEGLNIFKD